MKSIFPACARLAHDSISIKRKGDACDHYAQADFEITICDLKLELSVWHLKQVNMGVFCKGILQIRLKFRGWSFRGSQNMDVASLLFLLALAALGWFWFNSLHALEIARNAGRQVCGKANVQFLDDTVSSIGLALVRDTSGRRVWRRTYRFEFSETGNSRLEGRIILLGSRIESVTMEPYQILPSPVTGCDAAHALNSCDDKNTLADNGGAYGGCCGGCGGRDGSGSAGY